MKQSEIGGLIFLVVILSLWAILYYSIDRYNRHHRIFAVLYHDPYSSPTQVFIFYSKSLKEAEDFRATLKPSDFIGIYKFIPQNFYKCFGGLASLESKHSNKKE